MNSLIGVLIRFRKECIEMAAGVEQMFHQVKVYPEQTDSLRFLWWPDGDLQREPLPLPTNGSQTNRSRTNKSRTNGYRTNGSHDKWVPKKWVMDKAPLVTLLITTLVLISVSEKN